jgi:hypothetical protein
VLKNKTHAVTFRLDEDEYQELMRIVVSRGARSISDFARSAVMAKIASASGRHISRDDLKTLTARLEAFDLTLRDLEHHVLEVLSSLPDNIKPVVEQT